MPDFVDAIEQALRWTRPIHYICLYYRQTRALPGASTLFFVNRDGWALTAKHVVDELENCKLSKYYVTRFLPEVAGAPQTRRMLETRYRYDHTTCVEQYPSFALCAEGPNTTVDYIVAETADVALLHFRDFDKLLVDAFPIFPKTTSGLRPGKRLCTVGFPLFDFTNFEYDSAAKRVRWTDTGRKDSSPFPSDGMVTRVFGNQDGQASQFEMGGASFRSMSGTPVFDDRGRVFGMSYECQHLDTGFDVQGSVIRKGQERKISDLPAIHMPLAVHVDVLKTFMRANSVDFCEED